MKHSKRHSIDAKYVVQSMEQLMGSLLSPKIFREINLLQILQSQQFGKVVKTRSPFLRKNQHSPFCGEINIFPSNQFLFSEFTKELISRKFISVIGSRFYTKFSLKNSD